MATLIKTFGDNDQFKVYQGTAAEFRKTMYAVRGVKFMVRMNMTLGTTEGRAYCLDESITVSRAQMEELLNRAERFRELKKEQHPETPEADLPKVQWTICDSIMWMD